MSISRRHFLYGSFLATSAKGAVAARKSPSERLNIAAIGSGGKGFTDLNGCAGENIVALCDPDDKRAERAFNQFPNAPRYKDFRVMLDKEKDIDAVLVSCPDHMHATAAMWAMARGKHVYCQKPLTRTVWEAQQLTAAAAKYGVATQMGNQGYSNAGARDCAEIIWSGEIGDVTEVHAWTDRPGKYWPQGPEVEPKIEAVPGHLDWPPPRLDPRRQGRGRRLLQLLRRRAVRAVDAARRHRHEVRRQAGMGQRCRPFHQQQRSQ